MLRWNCLYTLQTKRIVIIKHLTGITVALFQRIKRDPTWAIRLMFINLATGLLGDAYKLIYVV